jgi:hypothetical protein
MFPGGQTVQNAWNATVTQIGALAHAVNASYNGALVPGAATTFGFQGTWSAPEAPSLTCRPARASSRGAPGSASARVLEEDQSV